MHVDICISVYLCVESARPHLSVLGAAQLREGTACTPHSKSLRYGYRPIDGWIVMDR